GTAIRKGRGVTWDSWLAVQARFFDVVHLHMGTLTDQLRFVRRPWVVHVHGTDNPARLYDAAWRPRIERELAGASAVVYATPDLAEHTRPYRPDAIYLPQPIDVTDLPVWRPTDAPRIVFSSRWQDVKGADAQLEVAARLVEATRSRDSQ